MPERLGGGEVVAARPWVVEDMDGGVLGREPEPDRFLDVTVSKTPVGSKEVDDAQ